MSYKVIRKFDTTDFGTGNLRVADLNGDCYPELLFTQNYPMNREISCLTATDLDGNILWQYGKPGVGGADNYADLPVQVYDWDGDGKNEVLFVQQAKYKIADMWCYSKSCRVVKEVHDQDEVRLDPDFASERAAEYDGDASLVVLDGATGAVKATYPVPAPADDCMAIGYFDGTGKPNLVIKDRYWNVWAVNNEGKELWHVTSAQIGADLGHYPGVGDIDGDGLDEVFITNTMFDSDGSVMWKIEDGPGRWDHHDSVIFFTDVEQPRIITGSDKIRCLSATGELLWEREGGHWQQVIAGKFSTDPKHGPYQFLGRDRAPEYPNYKVAGENGHRRNIPGQVCTLFDWNGNIIWSMMDPVETFIRRIEWTGGADCIAKAPTDAGPGSPEAKMNLDCRQVTITDGTGRVVDILPCAEGKIVDGGGMYAADVIGDSRDELISYTGKQVIIYANDRPAYERRHYNFTLFNGE